MLVQSYKGKQRSPDVVVAQIDSDVETVLLVNAGDACSATEWILGSSCSYYVS